MSTLTAFDAWDSIRARLSPEERLRFDMGQDVTVEMTHEEYDAIENDPLRRLIRETSKRVAAAFDSLLGATIQPGAPWAPMVAPPVPLRSDLLLNSCTHAFAAETCPHHGPVTDTDVADLHTGRATR